MMKSETVVRARQNVNRFDGALRQAEAKARRRILERVEVEILILSRLSEFPNVLYDRLLTCVEEGAQPRESEWSIGGLVEQLRTSLRQDWWEEILGDESLRALCESRGHGLEVLGRGSRVIEDFVRELEISVDAESGVGE